MEEIDLYDLLRFYAKKWLTIATFVMIGAILGVTYTYFVQTPEYTSKAQLLLVGDTRTSTTDSVVLNNYVQLFTSHRVLDSVIDEHKYDKGYDTLAANTTAENVKNTDIINVAFSTSDAKQSRALLEDAIATFSTEAKELYGNNNVRINVVDRASQPSRPTNIKPVAQIGLAVLAGFAAAIISLFFVYDYRASRRGKQSVAAATHSSSQSSEGTSNESKPQKKVTASSRTSKTAATVNKRKTTKTTKKAKK